MGFIKKIDELLAICHQILKDVQSQRYVSVVCPRQGTESERIKDAERMNLMLAQAVSEKYDKGTLILYDEHEPRNVLVVKDGQVVDMDKASALHFTWYKDEFPTLEISH